MLSRSAIERSSVAHNMPNPNEAMSMATTPTYRMSRYAPQRTRISTPDISAMASVIVIVE